MTLRDIVLLACKVVALFLFMTSIVWLLSAVGGLMTLKFGEIPEYGAGDLIIQSYWQIGASLLQVAAVIIMWWRSPQIAKRLVPESTFNRTLAIDAKWISPAIAITGMMIAVLGIRGLSSIGSIVYGQSSYPPELMGHVITSITQIVLGAGLYFKSHQISEKLQRKIQDCPRSEMTSG